MEDSTWQSTVSIEEPVGKLIPDTEDNTDEAEISQMEKTLMINSISTEELAQPSIQEIAAFTEETDDETIIPKKKKCYKIQRQYIAAFICLLQGINVGFSYGYSAPATYDMVTRPDSCLQPTKVQISWMSSILLLGCLIGSVVAGFLADKIGRKKTLLLNLAPCGFGWLLISISNSVPMLISGRFFCGVSLGVSSVTVPMYCYEVSTPDLRGMLGSSLEVFSVIGNLVFFIIGSFLPWNYLAVVGLIFTAFSGIFYFMPESPQWLIANDKLSTAIREMTWLRGDYVEAEEECIMNYQNLQNQSKEKFSLKDCMQPTVYKPTLITVALMFFQECSGINVVSFFSTELFEASKEFMDPETASIVLCVTEVLSTITSIIIVDKVGRKLLLNISAVFMALNLMILGTFHYLSSNDASFQRKYAYIPLVSLTMYMFAFSCGFGAIPWLIPSEIIALRFRSTLNGLATCSSSVFGFIIAKTFNDLEESIGLYGTFWLFGLSCIMASLFVYFIVPETKGKNIKDIEKFFKKLPESPQNQEELTEECIVK